MRTRATLLWCCSFALVASIGCSGKHAERVEVLERENASLRERIKQLEKEAASTTDPAVAAQTLPASLDALYPPKTAEPVLTMRMIAMAMPLESMVADLFDNDMEHAVNNFELFAEQYKEVAAMVPEWTDQFPQPPVDTLRRALESGDTNEVMRALGGLGAICQSCHVEHLAAVQYKFHWRDTSSLKVTDPATNEEVGYRRFMQLLSSSFSAVAANLQQGQKDAAVKQLEAFAARFDTLEESCGECHDTPRAYYVDDSIKEVIADIGKEIGKDAPDPDRVKSLMTTVSSQSCAKCHMVHLPAALWKIRGSPL